VGARPALLARILIPAAAIGIVARLLFGLIYWTDKPLTRDEQEYLSLARSLRAGEGFVYDDVLREGPIEPFGRAPGYPAFLAVIGGGRAPVSSVPAVVDVAQAVVGGIGVMLVGLLAYRLAGRAAATWAAALAAIYPPLVWISGYAMSEALFWPLALGGAWLVDRTRQSELEIKWALATGAFIGASILVRPGHVFFVPFAVLAIVGRQPLSGASGFARSLAALAVFIFGLVLIVGPWTARNYAHHGRFVFVASEGGVTFWTGNHPLAIGDGDMAANPAIKIDNQRLRSAHPNVSEDALEPIFYREALTWIKEHPLAWIALEFRKLFYLVVPTGPSYTLHSSRYLVLSIASYLVVLVFAILGIARTPGLANAVGLWALLASSVVAALVFFPQERFRIPIIDPTLVILAGAGVASLRTTSRRA
jgi:4-amino-4-deoxy-L-arabinose transferase-like glycosyltransferase